jgi:hypothetical protein
MVWCAMLVSVHASPNQLRWWLQSAINGFDDLDPREAIANARAELAAALEYLDRLDATEDAVAVFGVVPIEARIDRKGRPGEL